jgi:hypothetical protein
MPDDGERARDPGLDRPPPSRMNVTAQGTQGKSRGTFGAASPGKTLMAWSCACGWQGTSRELKAGPGGLACPMCGGGGLKPK